MLYFAAPVNAAADAFTFGEENSYVGYARLPLLFAIAALYLPHLKIDLLNTLIAVFLVYLLILVNFSSNPVGSFATYCKVSLCMLMFPIARHIIVNETELSKLRWSILCAFGICICNFVASQVFQMGVQSYGDSAFYTAGGGVYLAYELSYGLMLAPMMLVYIHRLDLKLLLAAVYAVGAIVIVFIFRRGAIAATFGGYATMLVLSRPKQTAPILATIAASLVALAAIAPIYGDQLTSLYEKRIVRGVQVEKTGSRSLETETVWREAFSTSLTRTLFGTELFNSHEYFHWWRNGAGRGLHIDMNILLHGAGIVGLLHYLLIQACVFAHFAFGRAVAAPADHLRLCRTTGLAIFVAGFVLSLSTQLWAVTPFSTLWTCLGGLYAMTSDLAHSAYRFRAPAIGWAHS